MTKRMIYGYVIVLGLYLLLFVLSRNENVSASLDQMERQSYPGEIFFLKAAVWCIRLKERFITRFNTKGRQNKTILYKEQLHRSRLGSNLKLLHPSLSEKQQVKEFYMKQYSLALLVLFVGNILSLCVALSAQTTRLLQEGNYINRKEHGQGQIEVALSAQIEGNEPEEIVYKVEAQKYTEDEIRMLYQEASAYLTEMILGGNNGLDRITEDLQLVTSMEGYPFQISWDSSSYSLIHTDGSVINEALEEPEIVTLTAHFQYEGMDFEDIFPVQVLPAVFTEEELLVKSIEDSLEEQNQASRTDSMMMLPKQVGSRNVIWKEVIQDSSGYFFLLMCIAAGLVFLSKNKEVEQNLEKRKKELLLDYPEVINKLTLYMGAGMTIRNAFLKMGEDYKKQKASTKNRYIYEEILVLCHEIQSGVPETEAYTHLGKRCQLQNYMKLCALLSQNIRKGSNDLLLMLRQEAANAFEERKNTAKKLGEEAGTKLLIPMMMMLCIVMALIMIPAFLSFG